MRNIEFDAWERSMIEKLYREWRRSLQVSGPISYPEPTEAPPRKGRLLWLNVPLPFLSVLAANNFQFEEVR